MTKLAIDNALLASLVGEVAPWVSAITGWNLNLTTLRCRLLSKEQGYEEIVLGRLQGVNIDAWKELMPDFIERMIEFMVEENALAAYMPGAGEILVLRENVDDSNLDGLKLVLAHELTHRAQHMAHGRLFDRLDRLIWQAFTLLQSRETGLQAMQQIYGQIQPIMTLLESHASYIQGIVKQKYLPEAKVEKHFNLATLLLRLIGAPKVAQYTEGLPQVVEAANAGSMDALFSRAGD